MKEYTSTLCWSQFLNALQGRSQGPKGPGFPPIEMLFQVFRLNSSWDMPKMYYKMYYFSNKFSKIAKHWDSPPPAHLNLRFWWPEVTRCGQILFFSSWLWRNRTSKHQLWRHFSNVIAIMSLKNVTKNVTKFFSILAFFQSKFLDTPVTHCIYYFIRFTRSSLISITSQFLGAPWHLFILCCTHFIAYIL